MWMFSAQWFYACAAWVRRHNGPEQMVEVLVGVGNEIDERNGVLYADVNVEPQDPEDDFDTQVEEHAKFLYRFETGDGTFNGWIVNATDEQREEFRVQARAVLQGRGA